MVFRRNDVFPAWTKLRSFEINTVREGERMDLSSNGQGTAIFVERGRLFVTAAREESLMQAWQAPSNGRAFRKGEISATTRSFAGYWMDRCTFYVFHGDWEEAEVETFCVSRCDSPLIPNPPGYEKNTLYSARRDDYEQAWVLISGHATVRVGAEERYMSPGDLTVIRAGEYHDFAVAHEFCNGVIVKMK